MPSEWPVILVFITGNGYQLGNFTLNQQVRQAKVLNITGYYDVSYRHRTFTIPVKQAAYDSPAPVPTDH
jgi:hypothetical protein